MTRSAEGTVAFRGFRTWYRVEGDLAASGAKLPLLVLHGGPGFPHDYLEDLAGLADGGRPVVFYDQLGCGKSDHPDDPALWVMSTFVEELGAVRAALGLDRSTSSATRGAAGWRSSTRSAGGTGWPPRPRQYVREPAGLRGAGGG